MDVNLDSVQALLLYIQWMPCGQQSSIPRTSSNAPASPRSRYNDVSAWSVLGLAARYATLLNLQKETVPTSEDTDSRMKSAKASISRLRALANLTSCDFNLMLSSGLPISINPTSTAKSIRGMATQSMAQYPGDLRVTALIELVSITHKACKDCKDFSGRRLDARTLRDLNADFDRWESVWVPKLANTESQHNHLPFTSVRWYRLTLNSASLGSILSPKDAVPNVGSQISLLQNLVVSLTAACQMIFSHSTLAAEQIWSLDLQTPSSFPPGPFTADARVLERLQYVVDSAWISFTFAVTFLVLCYVRCLIDGEASEDTVNEIS